MHRKNQYETLKHALHGDYPFEVLDHHQLKLEESNIGKEVAGAIFHHQDGHVNPLRLLKALLDSVSKMGATVKMNSRVNHDRADQ